MPTLKTTEHGEIRVHHRQVARMANRLWRLGSPARRTAYVEKARRRLAAGKRVTLMQPSYWRRVTTVFPRKEAPPPVQRRQH